MVWCWCWQRNTKTGKVGSRLWEEGKPGTRPQSGDRRWSLWVLANTGGKRRGGWEGVSVGGNAPGEGSATWARARDEMAGRAVGGAYLSGLVGCSP